MESGINKVQKWSLLGMVVLFAVAFIYINNYGKDVVPNIDILDEEVILETQDTFDLFVVTYQNELTWSSTNENVAIVDDYGRITALSSGETNIVALAANGTQDECKITVVRNPEKEVKIDKITVNKKTVKLKKGEEYQLEITYKPKNATYKVLNWSSSNENVVKVSNNGLIYGVSKGSAVITAKSENGKKTTTKVTVTDVNNEIVISRSEATIEENKTVQLSVKNTKENIIWSSSDTSVLTVSQSGLVKGIKTGTAIVSASTSNKTVTSKITVKEREKILELSKSKVSLEKDSTYKLKATLDGKEANNLTWKSSNVSVAEVSLNGEIKGVNSGTSTISVTTSDGKKVSCKVTVTSSNKTNEKLKLNKNEYTIKVGESYELYGKIDGKKVKNLNWSSNNKDVATVNSNGKIKGVKIGTTFITASNDKNEYDICKITVIANDKSKNNNSNSNGIALDRISLNLIVGDSYSLNAITDTKTNLTWSSNNNSVATVNSSGVVKAVKAGSATIKVTTSDGKEANCVVTVSTSAIYTTSIALNITSKTIEIGEKFTLTSTLNPKNATNNTIMWTSNNTSVVSVNSNGVVTGLKEGMATITAMTSNGKEANCVVTVETVCAKSITLNKTSEELYYNDSGLQLSATISPNNVQNKNLTWTSNNSSVATVSNTGFVRPLKPGDVKITAVTSNGKKAEFTLKVKEKKVVKSDSYPMTYSDSTSKITITKNKYNNNTVYYIAHLEFTDYGRLKTGIAANGKLLKDAISDKKAIFGVNGDAATYIHKATIRNSKIHAPNDCKDCGSNYDYKVDVSGVYSNITGILQSGRSSNIKNKLASSLIKEGLVTDTFDFGESIIVNGKNVVSKDDNDPILPQRNVIATTGKPGDIYIIVTQGRNEKIDGVESPGISLYKIANILLNLGAKYAVNLDGGGSALMYFDGKVLNKTVQDRTYLRDYVYFK